MATYNAEDFKVQNPGLEEKLEKEKGAEGSLTRLSRDEWYRFLDFGGQEVMDLDETFDATKNLGSIEEDTTQAATLRNKIYGNSIKRREGLGGITDRRAKAYNKNRGLGMATAVSSGENIGRAQALDAEKEHIQRKMGVRSSLLGLASQNFSTAATAATARENAWAAAKGEHGRALQSMGMSLGGALLSSRDFKENIESYKASKALDILSQIELVQFDYKEDMEMPAGKYIGVIAEDAPDEITTEDKKMINVYNTIGLLMGAVQDLSEQVRKLKG
jgi:hypothetical protein